MYADRMEGGARRPVKERLNNGNGVIGSTRQQQQRQITGKRSHIPVSKLWHPAMPIETATIIEPFSWKPHALMSQKALLEESFNHGELVPKKLGLDRSRQDDKWEHDLFDNDKPQITNCKVSAPDLRLKLQRKGLQLAAQSGKSSAPNMRDLHERLSGTMSPQLTNADQPKTKVVKSSSKSVGVEAPAVQIKRPADLTPKKSQKAGSSVDEFLRSLCLEKYLITFQAEEVDMTALNHMTDEDLKAMGIPMFIVACFFCRHKPPSVPVTIFSGNLTVRPVKGNLTQVSATIVAAGATMCHILGIGVLYLEMLTLPDSESLSIEEIAVQVSDFWLDEMKDDKLLVDNLQVSISEVPALDIPLMSLFLEFCMLVEFVSLEIISWNLSGLDDCRKRKRVREIISIASLTIVKLQETKLESFDALQDIRDLRFKDYGSSCLL
ncbi:hypothetical protein JHK84_045068 [Glycine max]|nr:hypothetical protein JHK86_045014 [Glycine max]KAG4951715.1 hypothetical protein JHK85_045582 [Glycine max]KAG5108161.1 hypothetical protein JHK84_045068 [Glycine max]